MRTIASYCSGRDNNFNLLRFIAASLVLLSHCWPLTTRSNASEPLFLLVGQTLGTTAVMVFFSTSGFLVTSSWERTRNPLSFCSARVFRIFPGLLCALLVSAFAIGPLISTLPVSDYFSSTRTWTYIPSNLLLIKPQQSLPGVLEQSHYKVLNGSLWTLAYEVFCYALLLSAACSGLLRRDRLIYLLGIVLVCALILTEVRGQATKGFAHHMLALGTSFTCGVCLWLLRERTVLNPWAAAALITSALMALANDVPGSLALFSASLAYGSLYLAFVPSGQIRRFNRLGDCSYGVYIYAFPVQQAIIIMNPGIGIAALFFISWTVTIVFASLSWKLIEAPSMRLNTTLTKRLVSKSTISVVL